jgi:hypothetical protein
MSAHSSSVPLNRMAVTDSLRLALVRFGHNFVTILIFLLWFVKMNVMLNKLVICHTSKIVYVELLCALYIPYMYDCSGFVLYVQLSTENSKTLLKFYCCCDML